MAPKKPYAHFTGFKPTEAELRAARSVLERCDDKGKRAKLASMMAFLKRNPSGENANIAATRGETRKDYLERYLAFQINDHGGNLVSEKQEWHGNQIYQPSLVTKVLTCPTGLG